MKNFIISLAILSGLLAISLASIALVSVGVAQAGVLVPSWPDAVVCTDGGTGGVFTTTLTAAPLIAGGTMSQDVFTYKSPDFEIWFNTDGTYDYDVIGTVDCTSMSISDLETAGQTRIYGELFSTTTVNYIQALYAETATSTPDQIHQNLWNAYYAFLAIVFMVLWLGRKK